MKLKILIPIIALIILIGVPTFAGATQLVHDFDCENCHKPGMDLESVSGIVCLDCHNSGMSGTTFPLADGSGNSSPISDSTFVVGDASNALGALTNQGETPGDQTSHNWAAPMVNSKAGAKKPSSSFYYGRQNSSRDSVTCSRCHDPHGYLIGNSRRPANPKLLKTGPDTESAMCNDCHVDWASDTAPSEGGAVPTNVHPMVANYAAIATAKPTEYNSVVELNASAGEVALNATGGIDCMSCHGVHFIDSNSSTVDGVQAGSLGHLNPDGSSRGKILRANGPAFDDAGVAGDSICVNCHKYGEHGGGRSNPIGCMVCHGAHIEDSGGSMNNYMLRTSITTTLPNGAGDGTVSGLTLDINDDPSQRLWDYCFACHDSGAAAIAHDPSWNCTDCHGHDDTDGSWTAAGACNTCHGYPPSQAVASDRNGGNAGYAVQADATNYKDNSGHYKDESTTLHTVHAGGGDYSFSCSACHAGAGHIDKSYDDVFIAVDNQLYNGNGLLTAAYNAAGSGSCSTVYCHSNGYSRESNTPTVNNPDVWAGGTVTNACDICHGNDVASMGSRSNSATHIAHLNKGYSCQVCHVDTADNATTLAAGAIGGTHIDVSADVAFDASSLGFALGSTSYGSNGSCSVYCHSNGITNVSPDWDLDTSGDCGSCHQYSNAGTATGSGAALGGAHSAHVYDASGPQLACSTCHTHDGATGSANTDHVNGTVDKVTNYMDAVCNPCHGSTNGGTGYDAEPVWVTPASVSCETCHTGSVIANITGGVSTPAKSSFDAAGHGKYGEVCVGCHSTAADNNHLGALDDTDRLQVIAGVTYNSANSKLYCYKCHGTTNENHFANTNTSGGSSTDANNCITCHDPHGQRDKNSAALDALLRADINGRVVTGFTNRALRASYYATGADLGEGICQTCHDPNEVGNFNRTTANTGHGGGSACVSCHPHTTGPAFKASCNGCHGDSGTGQFWPSGSGGSIPTANDEVGEHDKHVLAIGQQLTFGDYSDTMYSDAQQIQICEYCHAATTNDGDHGLVGGLDADVFVDFDTNRHAKFLDGTADANATYVAGTCNTVACHNGKSTDTADGTFNWTTGVNDPGCILCHNDMTNTGIATGQTHAAHTGASTLYGATINCASCHDSATNWSSKAKPANNHINGTFDMGGTVAMTYDGSLPTGSSFGSCGTNACHEDGAGNASVEESGDGYTWGTAEVSACGICHAASMATAAHDEHLASSYVSGCSSCHTAANAATHLNNIIDLDATQVVYVNPGLCSTNNCHATGNWRTSVPAPSCEDCHSGTYIGGDNTGTGGNNYLPQYGMHDVTPSTSGINHKVIVGCSYCHAMITAQTTHVDGTWETDSADNSAQNRGLYNNSPPLGWSDGSPSNCATVCHFGAAGDGGAWARKWSITAENSDGSECANCHGDFANGWVTGIADRHSGDVELAAYHGGASDPCMTCHAIGDGAGDYNWATDHRDGDIQLSNDLGWTDLGATVGCANCHSDSDDADDSMEDGEHEMEDTYDSDTLDDGSHDRWGREFINGGGGSCTTCHNDNGVGHANVATENATVHTAHVNSDYVSGCTDCHTNGGPGHVDHNNGTVNFNATNIGSGEDYLKANNFDGTCATNDCHDSDNGEWAAGNLGGDSCTDCHGATGKLLDQGGYPPTSNEHAAHLDNDALFLPASDCNLCHGANAVSGGHTGHMDKGANIDLGGEMLTYNTTNDNCTNNCHTAADNNEWVAGTLTCNDCHAKASNYISAPIHTLNASVGPTGDKHSNHTGADADYLGVATCTTCHGHSGVLGTYATSGHADGNQKTLDGSTISAYPDAGGAGSCANSCHLAADAGDWSNSGSIDCIDCHTSGLSLGASGSGLMSSTVAPATGKHTEHKDNTAYVASGCSSCHSHSGSLSASGHVNGPAITSIETTNKISFMAGANCTNSCHNLKGNSFASSVDDPSWNFVDTDVLGCADCHASTYIAGDNTGTGGNNYLQLSGLHAASTAFNHGAFGCATCHDTSDPNGAQHADGTFQNSKSAGAGFGWVAGITYDQDAGCAATCHGDAGVWSRKWIGVTDAKPLLTDSPSDAVCGNCHGTFGDWRLGVSVRHSDDDDIRLNHTNIAGDNECYLCHAWGDAAYTGTANVHNSSNILHLNDNVGFVDTADDDDLVGCGNCHAANDGIAAGEHSFTDTEDETGTGEGLDRWTRVMVNGPEGSCSSCHTSNGATHLGSNESLALHNAHNASPYIDTNDDFDSAVSATFNNCSTCHGHNGTGGHFNDNKVTFSGSITNTSDYMKAGTFLDNCTNSCHTAESGEWNTGSLAGGSTDACVSCHDFGSGILDQGAYPPTSNEHGSHLGSSNYVSGCVDCHPHSGVVSYATHVADDGIQTGGQLSLYNANDTCTNTCHTVVDGRDWTAGIALNCDDCHAATTKSLYRDRTGGSHPDHVNTAVSPSAYGATGNSSTQTQYDFSCGECHPTTTGNHLNGVDGEIRIAVGYAGNQCSNVYCHSYVDTANTRQYQTTPAWGGSFGGDSCTSCHGNSPISNAHASHEVGFHYKEIYSGLTGFLPVEDNDCDPGDVGTICDPGIGTDWDRLRGHGGTLSNGTTSTSTVMSCNVCHWSTVVTRFNAENTTCAQCHTAVVTPADSDKLVGNAAMTIADKRNHVDGDVDITFFPQTVRSKAQLRDELADVAEINSNWTRVNDYKLSDGSSYDEQPNTLDNLSSWSSADKTCTTSCHLWEAGRVDKVEVDWVDNSQYGASPLMCIDCHTRLPQ